MNFINFEGQSSRYDVAILIKDSSLKKSEIEQYYVNPLVLKGFKRNRIIAIGLAYGNGNKVSKKQIKDHLAYIVPNMKLLQVKYVMCADANYYKELANQRKADTNLDKMVVGKYDPDMQIVYSLNYSSLMYNPNQADKITMSIDTVAVTNNGGSTAISIPFTSQRYPTTLQEIEDELNHLLQFDELAVDIETFGLKLGNGIASIAFSESSTAGASFLVDYKPSEQGQLYGYRKDNHKVRALLKQFFKSYKGVMIYHRSAFDVKHLIWELFMDHPLDFKGMLEGVRTLGKNFADTLFMAFLTLNSTTRPNLGLKSLGYEFAGDYGEEEIKDVRKIRFDALLKYNLSDTCTTFWVMEKYWDLMVQEDQESVYWEFIKMQRVLFRTELHGMPMNEQRLNEVENILTSLRDDLINSILESDEVLEAEHRIIARKVKEDNKKLKTKVRTIEDYDDFAFNPGSDHQLRVLLHNVMQLPVVKVTPTKEPKTDEDTINILIHKTDNEGYKNLLGKIIEYSKVTKIITTFIKAFKEGMLKTDGRRYLHGNFNLAKVKSGRLSCSDPNIQQIPSGSTHAKLIKSIFQAPKGKLMIYSDFSSLEDYISALLSKDTNKMKVYLGHDIFNIVLSDGTIYRNVRDDSVIEYKGEVTQLTKLAKTKCENMEARFSNDATYDEIFKDSFNIPNHVTYKLIKVGRSSKYDGHSLRAYSYFPEHLTDIVDNVKSINSIKELHDPLRGKSKAPTFMMTYGGSEKGVDEKFGFGPEKSKEIYNNYHNLYVESDEYVARRLEEASNLGYVVLAFGLKLRCPLLASTVRNSKYTARGASEDERTLGNAMGQSYGMLNNRAMIATMDKVDQANLDLSIFPIAGIHDASYYIVDDDIEVVKFMNDTLIKEMQWQEDPAIAHDEVKLGAELDICFESWKDAVTIPNFASADEIFSTYDKGVNKILKKRLEKAS